MAAHEEEGRQDTVDESSKMKAKITRRLTLVFKNFEIEG